PGPNTELGSRSMRSPLVGVATQIRTHMGEPYGVILPCFVGASAALILLAAITTSISGFSRLAYSLGEHGQLPRAFGRRHRRTHVSPAAVVAATGIAIGLLIGTSFLKNEVTFLASLFSFG